MPNALLHELPVAHSASNDPAATASIVQGGEQEDLRQSVRSARTLAKELAKQQASLIERLEAAERAAEQAQPAHEVSRLKEVLSLAEEEINTLQGTIEALRQRLGKAQDEHELLQERFNEVERQYLGLGQAYVASTQLHSSLDPDEVVTNLRGILVNLVGAEAFGIYLASELTGELSLIAHQGLEQEPGKLVLTPEAGDALSAGEVHVLAANKTLPANPSRALAAIPLVTGSKSVGLIVIYRVFEQKRSFSDADMDLFRWLGGHAATALCAARAYSVSERKRVTLEGFVSAIRSDFQSISHDKKERPAKISTKTKTLNATKLCGGVCEGGSR